MEKCGNMGGCEQGSSWDLLSIAGVEREVLANKRQRKASPLFGHGPGIRHSREFATTDTSLGVFARTTAGENAKTYPIEDGMLELEERCGMRLAGFASGVM